MRLHKMLKTVSLRLMAMAMACPELKFVHKVCKVVIQSFIWGWIVNFDLHYWLFSTFTFALSLLLCYLVPFECLWFLLCWLLSSLWLQLALGIRLYLVTSRCIYYKVFTMH
jgi:hypothetical protein